MSYDLMPKHFRDISNQARQIKLPDTMFWTLLGNTTRQIATVVSHKDYQVGEVVMFYSETPTQPFLRHERKVLAVEDSLDGHQLILTEAFPILSIFEETIISLGSPFIELAKTVSAADEFAHQLTVFRQDIEAITLTREGIFFTLKPLFDHAGKLTVPTNLLNGPVLLFGTILEPVLQELHRLHVEAFRPLSDVIQAVIAPGHVDLTYSTPDHPKAFTNHFPFPDHYFQG